MWPKNFRVFKGSADLVRAVRAARDSARAEADLPQVEFASWRVPESAVGLDPGLAQEAVGERFLALLGALAISSGPVAAKVLVMPGEHNLAPEVRAGLAEYFGVTAQGEPFERFVGLLADEFYQWAKTHRDERSRFGLEFDREGRVYVDCPEQRPDLEPLED